MQIELYPDRFIRIFSLATCDAELELVLFSLAKGRHQGDIIAAFQFQGGPKGKLERDFLQGHVVIEQEATA